MMHLQNLMNLFSAIRLRCCPELANAAPIAPTAFSCPKFHAGYDPRGLLTCLLSSYLAYLLRDRGFLLVILRGSPFRGTWAWLIKNQFLTVAIEGEESPYTAFKRSLISLCDLPSKNKNRITDREPGTI